VARMDLLLLEHININIPHDAVGLARCFFVEGLRCKENEHTDVSRQLHVNLGLSQFHLPFLHSVLKREPITDAQRVDGFIEIATRESLEGLLGRLRFLEPLKDRVHVIQADSRSLVICGPFGNVFKIEAATLEEVRESESGEHPCGTDSMVKLRRLVFNCPIGSSISVANFFRDNLFCRVILERGRCIVPFLYNQTMEFHESLHAENLPFERSEVCRYHVAFYMQSSFLFERAFEASCQRGLIFVNPRFKGGPIEFASSENLREAQEAQQFRLKNIPKLGSNFDISFQLEQEVRHPSHICMPIGQKSQY